MALELRIFGGFRLLRELLPLFVVLSEQASSLLSTQLLQRWRWDLNPRRSCPLTRFRGVLLRPLGHSTADQASGPPRCASKKSVSTAAHSSASTPLITSGRWLSRRSRTTSHNDPTAPAFGSAAPYTTRSSRASTIAPAHIVHGSSVTTSVQPVSRH